MWNFKFKKTVIFASVLFLQPLLDPGSLAFAKKRVPKAFTFIAEGGKASQAECDGESKIPRKLKHLKEFAKAGSYMGSELQKPEINVKPNEEMWKHFFKVKASCNTALEKTPSSVNNSLKNTKVELPPDESADSDEDAPETDGPDNE